LLNNRQYLVTHLRELFEVRHQTVSSWLVAWETYGLMGLYDNPRSGRPPILTADEQNRFLSYWEGNSLQTKAAIARLQAETGKEASIDTFKRVLKKMAREGAVAVY
jgi:transposase